MRNMSFALTKKQILNQSKTVTRRFGWWFANPGMVFQPVEKTMGLKAGEKMVHLGNPIMLVDTRHEPLNAITQADVILEGFPNLTPEEFIAMLVKHYKLKVTDRLVNRLEFDYLNALGVCINPRCMICFKKMEFGSRVHMKGYDDVFYSCRLDQDMYKDKLEGEHLTFKHLECVVPDKEIPL